MDLDRVERLADELQAGAANAAREEPLGRLRGHTRDAGEERTRLGTFPFTPSFSCACVLAVAGRPRTPNDIHSPS
eukprot:138250-Prymnesium_polylepis.1